MAAVAPVIWVQPAGKVVEVLLTGLVHLNQALVKVGVGLPTQVPVVLVSTDPTPAVPVIVGATVFTGAEVTATVAADQRVSAPSAFVAVTA